MQFAAWCLIAALTGASEPDAVVLEFTRPSSCVPCQQVAPIVTRLQREGLPIRVIDVDSQPGAAAQHRLQIHAVPTFVLLIAGREADRVEGYNGKATENDLRRLCERARVANVRAPVEKPETRNPKSESTEFSQPREGHTAQPPTPVVRAKNDDTANLPPITSADPLHVCPRIRVKDSLGVNFGTGTIIDSREGRTTILTCGHIFRKLDDKSVIEVDVFHGAKHETFVGRVIRYDLEADVGLLWIPTSRPLPAAPIADASAAPTAGQHVFSVGCSGGDPPTKLQHRVTALNRYLGPDNIECTGVPIQGRSGGGLFDTTGRLIGVCIAADQRDQRGLYAALAPVCDLLNQAKLAHLIPQGALPPTAERSITSAASSPAGTPKTLPDPIGESPFEIANPPSPFSEDDSPFAVSGLASSIPFAVGAAATSANQPPLKSSAELNSTLAENGEAEVVCIIRPLNNPRATSRVVIINRASGKFLSQLAGELDQQAQPTSALVRQAQYNSDSKATDTVPRPYRRSHYSKP